MKPRAPFAIRHSQFAIHQPPYYRRHPWGTLALVAITALVVLGRVRRAPPAPQPVGGDYARYHGRVFTVVKVVDGDTIDIDAPDRDKPTTRIRLWGVDTPEVSGSRGGEMYWGAEASAFAKATVLNEPVRLELVEGDTRGKYGRLLAYVFLESTGKMFNEALLIGGHAYGDSRFPHPYRERFLSLEAEARSAGAGLWAGVTVEQMPRWRRKRNGE